MLLTPLVQELENFYRWVTAKMSLVFSREVISRHLRTINYVTKKVETMEKLIIEKIFQLQVRQMQFGYLIDRGRDMESGYAKWQAVSREALIKTINCSAVELRDIEQRSLWSRSRRVSIRFKEAELEKAKRAAGCLLQEEYERWGLMLKKKNYLTNKTRSIQAEVKIVRELLDDVDLGELYVSSTSRRS